MNKLDYMIMFFDARNICFMILLFIIFGVFINFNVIGQWFVKIGILSKMFYTA